MRRNLQVPFRQIRLGDKYLCLLADHARTIRGIYNSRKYAGGNRYFLDVPVQSDFQFVHTYTCTFISEVLLTHLGGRQCISLSFSVAFNAHAAIRIHISVTTHENKARVVMLFSSLDSYTSEIHMHTQRTRQCPCAGIPTG